MIKHRIELLTLLPKNPIVVEVGVAEGLFSRDLLEAGAGLLYSVDNWGTLNQSGDGGHPQEWHDANYKNTVSLMEKYGARSIMLRGLSTEMANKIANKSVHLVYIDCWHTYEGTTADIEAYWPKLVSGGVMGFHDYENPAYGVKQAVQGFSKKYNVDIHLIPENSLADAGAYMFKL